MKGTRAIFYWLEYRTIDKEGPTIVRSYLATWVYKTQYFSEVVVASYLWPFPVKPSS